MGPTAALAQTTTTTTVIEETAPPPPDPSVVVVEHPAPPPTTIIEERPRIVEERPVVVPVAVRPRDIPRLRFHGGLAGGFFAGGMSMSGGMGGLVVALGLQANQFLALYLQSIGQLGAFVASDRYAGAVGAFLFNSLMAEVTLGHVLQVGLGPSLDFLGVASCDASNGCQAGSAGPFFGLDARIALAIGGHEVGPRGGFFIAADIHPTFFDWGSGTSSLLAVIFSVGGIAY